MPRTKNQTIFNTSPTISITSIDFFETEFDKCLQITKEMCTTIIKVVENAIFLVDYVEEMEVMHIKYA